MQLKHSKSATEDEIVSRIVEESAPLSDAQLDALMAFADACLEGHSREPGGITIEIGTRAGGSALIFARILKQLYDLPPPFITVDPYGYKPYLGGDHTPSDELRPYGLEFYASAKSVLAPYTFHCHYLLEAMDFFRALGQRGMWHLGNKVPFARCASFVLLDGNHDAESICEEIAIVRNVWLRPHGVIFVDNAENDPRLKMALSDCQGATFFGREWAIIRDAV